jgi:hypothetical protein
LSEHLFLKLLYFTEFLKIVTKGVRIYHFCLNLDIWDRKQVKQKVKLYNQELRHHLGFMHALSQSSVDQIQRHGEKLEIQDLFYRAIAGKVNLGGTCW